MDPARSTRHGPECWSVVIARSFRPGTQPIETARHSAIGSRSRPSGLGCPRKIMRASTWTRICLFPATRFTHRILTFIPPDLNRLMVDSQAIRGDLPIGVSWHKARQRFVAQCRNPCTGRHEFLGYHTSASEAHQAWREHKHQIAIAHAETQSDPRIAAALRTRYAA